MDDHSMFHYRNPMGKPVRTNYRIDFFGFTFDGGAFLRFYNLVCLFLHVIIRTLHLYLHLYAFIYK